jgi:hypothetical protein
VVTVARASDSEYPVVLHRRPGRVTVTAALVTDVCVFITAVPITKLFAWGGGDSGGHVLRGPTSRVVCLLLQYLLQSCSRGGGGTVEDMCYEGLRAELCVYYCSTGVCFLLQYLIQNCARGGRRIVEDMCYEIRRAEA